MASVTALPQRHSIRFRDRDYRREASYMLTLCSFERDALFGQVWGDDVILSDVGEVIRDEWLRSSFLRPYLQLGPFVVMPNHFHAVVHLDGSRMKDERFQPGCLRLLGGSLGSLVAGFKRACTVRVNEFRSTPGARLWHRNYWEDRIRGPRHLERAISYIRNNPRRWKVRNALLGEAWDGWVV